MQKKSFNSPDNTMKPPKAKNEIINISGVTLIRSTFEPGWKWSVSIGSKVGTDSCDMHHLFCMTAGHLKVVMKDGSELEVGPGEVVDIPAGHDAWVVGDEPVMGIDLGSAIFDSSKVN